MKQIYSLIIDKFTDDEAMLDNVIVSLFVKTNKLSVKNNELIKAMIIPDDSQYSDFVNDFKHTLTFEDLIKMFELAIPKEDVIVNGAVYTPDFIKEYIVNSSFVKGQNAIQKPISEWMCADISCGCGAFLYTLAKKIKHHTNSNYSQIFKHIYGFDICQNSINRAKVLLSLLAISEGEDEKSYDFKLYVGNSLDSMISDTLSSLGIDGYDIIVGNPPYVRSKNIDVETKSLLNKWSVSSGNADLYIPFFEIGLSSINSNGILGYITVNTFFKSVNARLLRKYLQNNQYEVSIIDFGQELIFEKKLAYTCVAFLSKQQRDCVSYKKLASRELASDDSTVLYNMINYNSLDFHKGWMLNEYDIVSNITKIERVGTPLGELYDIKNGLATLANGIYIFKPISEDSEYYYHQSGDDVYKIERAVCKDIIKPNIVKSEKEVSEKLEKIIFPYSDNKIIEENVFASLYPYAYKYLVDNKAVLDKRDKGNGKYAEWFAFGRTQALYNRGKKLLIPYMSDKPYAVYTDNENMLIYCGYAIYGGNTEDMLLLKKVLESSIFDYYIKHTSKPYSTGYYSYAKNYIKHFGVCKFTDEEKDQLKGLSVSCEINRFLCDIYGVNLA